ncbi:unnamed protein product, partial [Clonostachys byssicola]
MGLGKTLIMIGIIMAYHRYNLILYRQGVDRWLAHLRATGRDIPDIPRDEHQFEGLTWISAMSGDEWLGFGLPTFIDIFL